MTVHELSPAAAFALIACYLHRNGSRDTAAAFASRHGVSTLYRLALQLEAATAAGF